jgi:hypothetical protein
VDAGIPACVEDAYEVIAAAFHWPPRELDGMGLDELMDWEQRAAQWLRAQRTGGF